MVFKLVRIDSVQSSKIKLPIGTHIIGRGKFLHNDETDKRVSRKHAELEVTTDTLNLKSLHKNPCFFIKKCSAETHIVHQDVTVSLCHGDKFGLLPDNFWYEVLQCPDQDEEEESITMEVKNKVVDPDTSTSLSLLNTAPTTDIQGTSIDAPMTQNTDEYDIPANLPSADERSPAKRNRSSRDTSPVDVKKVKVEPSADDRDATPGPSNHQQAPSDNATSNGNDTSPSKPTPGLRERCIYGANCYRRNPQHKSQFSHPGDADWGAGERGVCPYGGACRRAHPRHWDTHSHPPGTLPPARTGNRQKKRHRSYSESDDEDSVSQSHNLIVTGKRNRKTIQRQDWSGEESDGEKDPYATDESDEWQPSTDATASQDYSQDL